MPSSYSPDLRLELPADGEQTGLWGQTTNRNLGTLIESAIAGTTSVSVTTANQALTALNGADDQARHAMLVLTTTTGANFAVYAPPASKTYIVRNASSYTATIYNSTVRGNTTAAGAGVAVPAGKTLLVFSDGTNVRTIDAAGLTGTLAVANGGTGATAASGARTNLGLVIGTNVPSPTGTGASGTWGINISGNAATATSATTATTATTATQLASTLGIAAGGTGQTTAAGAFAALKQAATESATGVVELATNAEAAAGTDTTRAVTPAGLAAGVVALAPVPTTENVLAATAGASAGAIGTYAMARRSGTSIAAFGSTVAGSQLVPSGITESGVVYGSGLGLLSGTWRCMGRGEYDNPFGQTLTLWLRIS
jgi:hypothetical protein